MVGFAVGFAVAHCKYSYVIEFSAAGLLPKKSLLCAVIVQCSLSTIIQRDEVRLVSSIDVFVHECVYSAD